MKALPVLAAVAGVAAMAVLVGYFGAGAVMRSLLAVGATGFVAILAIHLAEIYRRRGGLWANFALHLACWIASAVEVWLALQLAGEPLPFAAVLAIESLLYAIRTAAFVVPNAMGVQEGAYILLGAGFGLTPEMSLALSLLKRGRDLAIGLPTIAVWQAIESNRFWRRRNAAAARLTPLAPAPPPD